MAITKVIPVKVNTKVCINYIINKDKTNEQTLVTCHGCSEQTADTFFKIANAKNNNQRSDQKPNLAYHFIQSFPPGENITPEQAHEIGQKYIEELLGSKYAFVMSTHVDKGHVHNHFCVCASEMDMSGKKMENDLSMIHKMRKANDKVCQEAGLSVIKNPKGKGKHYKEWLEDKATSKGSQKTQVKNIVDSAIKQSSSWEEFLKIMKDQNVEISQGNSKKYGTVTKYKLPDYERVIRGYTLGERYSDDKIKERIQNRVEYMENRRKANAERKASMTPYERKEDRNTLKAKSMYDTTKETSSDNRGLLNWQKQQNQLLFAKITRAAREKYGLSFSEFGQRIDDLSSEKKEAEERISELKKNIEIFSMASNNAEVYKSTMRYKKHFEQAQNQEAYFQSHDSEILAFNHAEAQLQALGIPLDNINADYLDKIQGKLSDYQGELDELEKKLTELKKEEADVKKWKADMDIYLGISDNKETAEQDNRSEQNL